MVKKTSWKVAIQSQQDQRDPIVPQIDPQSLEIYRSIGKAKNGFAVAKLEDECMFRLWNFIELPASASKPDHPVLFFTARAVEGSFTGPDHQSFFLK